MTSFLKKKRAFTIVIDIMIQLFLFFPWICMKAKSYCTAAYAIKLFSSGNILTSIEKDLPESMGLSNLDKAELQPMLVGFAAVIILLVLIQFICLLDLVLTVLNREVYLLNTIALIGGPVAFFIKMSSINFGKPLSDFYLFIVTILLLIKFIGVRMIDDWEDANKEYAENKVKDRAFKAERKKRLSFPGKYSGLFYQIIWKNFRSGWKDYAIFVLAGTVDVCVIFVGIGMAKLLSPLSAQENILRGQGIGAILLNFLIVTFIISVFLIISVLSSYLRKQMKNYGIFLNLGMRKRALYLAMGLELIASMLISVAAGYLAGSATLLLVREILKKIPSIGTELGNVSVSTYLFTLLFLTVVILVSLIIIHDMFLSTWVSATNDRAAEEEKMPGRFKAAFLAAGILITIFAFLQFGKRTNAEGIFYLLLLMLGVFLLARNGWGMFLTARKNRRKRYFNTLIKNNFFYHRFKTTFRYVFLISVVHIMALFMFSKEMISNMTAQQPESLFPYDYMCMATDKDDGFFADLKAEYGISIDSYPMVRATNVDNSETPDDYRVVMIPQGQHIGISETTYKKLCGKLGVKAKQPNLADDGSEIYIIYQQDKSVKAHPIDYYYNRTEPCIYIGQPVDAYDFVFRERIFQRRGVAGEEIGILTGDYRQGEYENIIVFSDKYIDSVKDDWKKINYQTGRPLEDQEPIEDVNIHQWPTRLVLMDVEGGKRAAVEKELQTFKKNHEFDEHIDSQVLSYYSSEEQIEQMKGEHIMTIAVNAFMIITLLVISLFILYLKFTSEIEEKRKRRDFLVCIGMKRKERIQALKKEIWVFFCAPLLLAAALVPMLTVIMWRLRLYTVEDAVSYGQILAAVAAAYLLVEAAGVKMMEVYIIRKVEGRDEGGF